MGETCSFCSTEMPPGATICRGCGAELVIGASPGEQLRAGKWGAFCGFGAYLWLLGQFRGLSFTFIHMLILMFLGYLAGAFVAVAISGRQVRFFRTGRRW